MHVVHQEHALLERRQRLVQCAAVEAARDSLQAVEHAALVALGLQLAEKPGAGVRQRLVVQVDRVLRRQHDADAEGARLLEQRQERQLGRRVGDRRQVAEHFVHVQERAQRTGAGLAPRPFKQRVQHQRHHQHALGVTQVGNRHDGDPGLSGRVVQHRADVQRHAVEPHVEAGRRQHAVEAQRQLLAILGRIERFEVQHADAIERRPLDLLHQPRQIGRARGGRRRGQDRRNERQLAVVRAKLRVTGQRQQARRRAGDPRARVLVVLAAGAVQRAQQRQRRPGPAARCVDAHGGRALQGRDPVAGLVPLRQALGPHSGLILGQLVGRHAASRGVGGVDPGAEVRRREAGKGQEQIREVALWIDRQHRNPVDRRLLDEADAESGLATAGHADAHRMRDQVLRVVEDRFGLARARCEVVALAEIEQPQLLVVHRHAPR